MDRDKERTNVHIVRSEDTGEESTLKENQGKSPPGKKHLPRGPTSYMQEMIVIGGVRDQPPPQVLGNLYV